ncbi:MAG: septal ring lytic transglycosylase RlpA family protein [Alphaproteobacteria bacterium]|nr:septal ring lytic transglycosylase RlpA family protein [Alphaproteobacteria bacterium]
MDMKLLAGAFVAFVALTGNASALPVGVQDQHHKHSTASHSVKKKVRVSAARKHPGSRLIGKASWYEPDSANPGRTAAHRTLPFGTRLKVTNLRNGRPSLVMGNERGPFIASRLIDVSQTAARELGMLSEGIAQVRVEVIARN